MKINLKDIDTENFLVKEENIVTEKCYLITPKHQGCEWNNDNLIYRSSMWNSDGELISAGFPKFFNYDEANHIIPCPDYLSEVNVVEKIDGSCLILSVYNGQRIIRTRGSFSLDKFDNKDEIDYLFDKYQLYNLIDSKVSYIFEWYSPRNKIILDYGNEPLLWLTGCVRHEDYVLMSQYALDILADIYGLQRPQKYVIDFQNVDINNVLSTFKELKDKEGVCIYYNNDQNIKKLKTTVYLKKHFVNSRLNLKSLFQLWIEYKYPAQREFEIKLLEFIDFESKSFIQRIIDYLYYLIFSYDVVVEEAKEFVDKHRGMTKKEFALNLQKVGAIYAPLYYAIFDCKYVYGVMREKWIKNMVEQN